MFLTIDNLNKNNIWKKFFDKADKDKYSIYVHAKYPKKIHKDSVLYGHVISKLKETKHGYLTEAMLSLFKAALKDKNNKYFALVSNSCIPIKSFDYIYNDIFNVQKRSIVGIMDISRGDYIKYNRSKLKIKKRYLYKYSQWSILKRNVLKKIVKSPHYKDMSSILAGDEFYLSILKDHFKYVNLPATFVDWKWSEILSKDLYKLLRKLKIIFEDEKNHLTKIQLKKYEQMLKDLQFISVDIGTHPKEFKKIKPEDIKILKKTKAYFARKFTKNSNINKYINNII